jgi:DNA-binding PadR family transcriptional regulator
MEDDDLTEEVNELLEEFLDRGILEYRGDDENGEPTYGLGPNADLEPEILMAWENDIYEALFSLQDEGLVKSELTEDGLVFSITEEGEKLAESLPEVLDKKLED